MTQVWASHLGNSLQIVLGLVFLVAAAGKLRKPRLFVATLRGYDLLPARLAVPVAGALVVAEALIAASFLTGLGVSATLAAAGALLLGFAAAVGVNLRRGRAVPCGCFGSAIELISPRTLARIGMLMGATATLAALHLGGAPTPTSVMSGTAVESLVLSAVLAISAAWLLSVAEIRALFRPRPSGT